MYRYTLNSAGTSKSKLTQNETISSEHETMTPIKVKITNRKTNPSHSRLTGQFSSMSVNQSNNYTSTSFYNSNNSLRSTPEYSKSLHKTNQLKELRNNHQTTSSSADVAGLNAYLISLKHNINRRTEISKFKRAVSEITDRCFQESVNTFTYCDCTMCSKQIRPVRMDQHLGFNTRSLLTVIDDIRPTIKIRQNSRSSEFSCPTSETSRSIDKIGKKNPHNMKKIELWNEKEVRSLIQPQELTSNSNESANILSNNRNQSIRNYCDGSNMVEKKNNLIRIFKEFKLDPYLSPLIKQLQAHSELRHEMLERNIAKTPLIYRKDMPENPPATPMY